MAEARLPWVIYGDGLFAQLLKIRRGIEEKDGVKIVECKIRPTEELLRYANIDVNSLDPRDNSITVRYQENMVVPLNDDPAVGCVFILCDFYGRDTRMTFLYDRLLQTIESYEKQIKSFKNEIAYLRQEMSKTRSQQERATQELVRQLAPIMKLRGNVDDMLYGANIPKQTQPEVEYPGP